jgi:hypothetical protein
MKNITTTAELKFAIKQAEDEQHVKFLRMKDQFLISYENLHPVKLLENSLKVITSSPYLVTNISGAAVGAVTGYLSRKVIVNSPIIIRKLLGRVLQYGITNLIAKNPDSIRSFVLYIRQHFIPEKEVK